MSKLYINRRALLISSGAVVLLGACSDLIGPPAAAPIYLLRPKQNPAAGAAASWRLTIDLPDAPDALDTARIALTQPNLQMDYYANAQWPDNLPDAVQNALVEAFDQSKRIQSVGRATEGLKSDYFLSTYITDFQARYDVTDGTPTAVVRITAKLIGARSREVVQFKDFEAEQPAGMNSVGAAVEALNGALGSVMDLIVPWTLSAPIPGRG